MSVDSLLEDEMVEDELYMDKNAEENVGGTMQGYIQKKCTVELVNWNDGVFDSYLMGEDEDFIYYMLSEKDEINIGAIGKKYVKNIEVSNKNDKYPVDLGEYKDLGRGFFIGKMAKINLDNKYFWSGFLGGDVEFLNAEITGFSSREITMEIPKRVISVVNVVKIERDK